MQLDELIPNITLVSLQNLAQMSKTEYPSEISNFWAPSKIA